MPPLKHAHPVQTERDGKGGGELYWHSGAGSGVKRHPVACCLSGYFKGEFERRGRVIREEGETMVNGPGGILAFPETYESVKETKIKALCQHTSKHADI